MSVGGNVWVHAKCDLRGFPQLGCAAFESTQFRDAFQVKQEDSRLESSVHFGGRLTYAGKDDLFRSATFHSQYPRQFPAGNHVESATELCQHAKNAEIRIRFYRVANRVVDAAESVPQSRKPLANRVGGIDVEGSSEALGKGWQGSLF